MEYKSVPKSFEFVYNRRICLREFLKGVCFSFRIMYY